MKPLLLWLAVVGAAFGGLAYLTTALRDTTRVFVVIDTSFEMREVWPEAQAELDEISSRRHAEFALATEKDLVHTWLPGLELGSVEPYAPCDFDGLDTHAEVAEADERILITTEASCDASGLTEWQIIVLEP